MRLSALTTDALASLASDGKSTHTVAAYEVTFRQFVHFVTVTRNLPDDTKSFTAESVLLFKTALHEGGANPNTIRARLSSLTFLGDYATIRTHRDRPVCAVNPVKGIKRPKRKRPEEKWLQPVEWLAFREVKVEPRLAVIRLLLCDIGIRVSELCDLTWGALSQQHGHWFLSTRVKGDHHASLPLSPDVANELERWFDVCLRPGPSEPILRAANDKKLKRGQLSYITQKIARQAGIDRGWVVTPHVVRHTLNVIRRQAHIDPTLRSALLAHTSPASLISYEHTSPEELIAARAQQRQGEVDYLKNVKSLWQLPEGGSSKS